MSKLLRKNDQIRAPRVMLIDEGKNLGEVTIEKALELAKQRGLDLVEISPQNTPPVCKILDFGSFLYNIKKKEKLQRKASKQTETKTIRLGVATDKHDLEVKARQARQFLKEKAIVKVNLIFHGREITHSDLGLKKMDEFYKLLEDVADIEQRPKQQGFQMNMILNPKK